ncbi:MAG TPA: DUF488 family protein [Methylomirabilota bacterium]|nr:DUF488 family protein [Methylomirabilota bacterium]
MTRETRLKRPDASKRIRIKRAYDPSAAQDGRRILVDRLWPRGLSRQSARIEEWARDLAPSAPLRKWFGHDPKRWPEFQKRYQAELRARPDRLAWLAGLARRGRITLVYAARDPDHNNARVLQRLVARRLGQPGRRWRDTAR